MTFSVALVFGLLLIGAGALNPGALFAFGILGLLVAGAAGYLLYDKRQRVQRASEETV